MFKSFGILLNAVVSSLVKILGGVDHFSTAFSELGRAASLTATSFADEVDLESQISLEALATRKRQLQLERDKVIDV